MRTVIRLEHVSMTFREEEVLHDLSFEFGSVK